MDDPTSSTGPCPSRRRTLAWAALACLLQAGIVGLLFVRNRGAFDWDPAHHSLWGLTVYLDVVRGQWISFLLDTYRQVYWPFLHSWAIAAAMLGGGPTLGAARLVSLAATGFTGITLAWLAHAAGGRFGPLAAAATLGLWLSASGFAAEFASEAYTEALALAVTGAALLALKRTEERSTPGSWALAGLLAMVVYFTKTDYGILLMTATVGGVLWEARRSGHRPPWRKLLAWAAPIMLLGAIWFAVPGKLLVTWEALVNRPQGPPPISLEGARFHLEQLMVWSDGPVIFALFGVGFVASLLAAKGRVLTVVVLYVVIAFLAHTLSQTNSSKHIVKLLPWLCLLAGWQFSRAWAWGKRLSRPRLLRSLLATIGLALLAMRITILVVGALGGERLPEGAVTHALMEYCTPGRSHLIVGEFGPFSPYGLSFALLASHPASRIIPDPINTKQKAYRKESLELRIEALRARLPWVEWFEPRQELTTYYIAHAPTKRDAREVTRADVLFKDLEGEYSPDRVMILEVLVQSVYSEPDPFVHPGADFLPVLESMERFRPAARIEFQTLGLRLHVFDRDPAR